MLLTIDVGNTETKLGCFENGADALLHHWRVTTESRRTADEYGAFFTQLFATGKVPIDRLDSIVIASVVPKLEQVLIDACRRFFNIDPVFFKPHRQQLIPILTKRPGEVGADLVAAALGAREKYGSPLLVISFGTASAFMAISPAGEYLGVAIAPGIAISIDALVGHTAKLPQIALESPGNAIGRDTIEALQSGIIYGYVGQTEALVARIRAEMGVDAQVIATGGLANLVARHTKTIDAVDPHLSLFGLKLFYQSNN